MYQLPPPQCVQLHEERKERRKKGRGRPRVFATAAIVIVGAVCGARSSSLKTG